MSRFDTTFNTRVMPANERAFGVAVCLSRGALVSEEITARRQEYQTVSMGQEVGIDMRINVRDYLLPVASVVLDGDETQPRAGDILHIGTERWEAFCPNNETPAAEPFNSGADWLTHVRLLED
jgi:hypothetical protein